MAAMDDSEDKGPQSPAPEPFGPGSPGYGPGADQPDEPPAPEAPAGPQSPAPPPPQAPPPALAGTRAPQAPAPSGYPPPPPPPGPGPWRAAAGAVLRGPGSARWLGTAGGARPAPASRPGRARGMVVARRRRGHRRPDPGRARDDPVHRDRGRRRGHLGGDDDVAVGAAIVAFLLWFLLVALVALAYAPVLMMRKGEHNGQSWGKQVLGIRVTRDNGQPFDFWSGGAARDRVQDRSLLGDRQLLHPASSRISWTTSGRCGTTRTARCTTWPRRRTSSRPDGRVQAAAAARRRSAASVQIISSRAGPDADHHDRDPEVVLDELDVGARVGGQVLDRAGARDVLVPAGQVDELAPRAVQHRLVVGELVEARALRRRCSAWRPGAGRCP